MTVHGTRAAPGASFPSAEACLPLPRAAAGDGRIVVEDYEQPDVRLHYWGQTAGTDAGFDLPARGAGRFGRAARLGPADHRRPRPGILPPRPRAAQEGADKVACHLSLSPPHTPVPEEASTFRKCRSHERGR